MFGAYADLFTRTNLVSDVNSRRRIFAHTHRRQADDVLHHALDFSLTSCLILAAKSAASSLII